MIISDMILGIWAQKSFGCQWLTERGASDSLKSQAYQNFSYEERVCNMRIDFQHEKVFSFRYETGIFSTSCSMLRDEKHIWRQKRILTINDGVLFLFFILELSYEIIYTLFITSISSWAWWCWTILQNKGSNGAFFEPTGNCIKSAVLFWPTAEQPK